MANKTQPTDHSPNQFLESLESPAQKADARILLEMMQRITGEPAIMWGKAIVGFGRYHYRYASGREGDWMLTGFSPRKGSLSVYIMPGFECYQQKLKQLGPVKTGKSCLYIKRLSDVDLDVLQHIIADSVIKMRARTEAGST
ncbi:hypothetical protein GCM10007972_24980 [Iodidimonas muriae]|uniref:YdhG-like domain-containing protein n=1 Tax=Iodidimonas muriae TaxID=261467 RepID=A0ABQ2LG61_9PROT|nr:DUF1801 domain-containing protein [Iodidimonas muriae]GER08341.1 hypothetical protein JCM17843_26510 [Kordiimonadales bacterium JCM 17843]GGO16217.1 hypothetical protein GCM10007972_24980 [Iodidimonas muriae]